MPPNVPSTPVPESTMRAPGSGVTESKFDQVASGTRAQTYALGVATVIQVDWEKHAVTLRTDNGETVENAPIMLTYPGAGARHFLGAMPMPGDVALVGWGAGESGRSKQPYVVGWFAAPMAGHDWWLMQPFAQDEFDLTPKEKETFEGLANRTRYKLRHMLPGNIVASSGQGSDMVLDESVTLANRRGNEIILRDQDQAIVFRSLQQFHAGAGFRVYSGLVQRDANLLPSSMFSDGTAWDAAQQLNDDGTPLDEGSLERSSVASGYMTPNKVFQRDANGKMTAKFVDAEGNTVFPFGGNIDPYVFLQKGLFIDTSGASMVPASDAVYGGKAIYRVSEEGTNAVTDVQVEALTEYRVEVSLTSSGTLPVTEQTDGFDADRLPNTMPRLPSGLNDSGAAPFIEFVMGSVVGNDPFSLPGRALYGLPLRASIFDGGATPSPTISSGVGQDIAEHAAYMLRFNPPKVLADASTFWTVTKDGRAKFSVAGPGTDFSAEGAFASGLRLYAGGSPMGESIRVDAEGKISLRTTGSDSLGRGVEIVSESGTVVLRGAGQVSVPGSTVTEPGVMVQSDTDLVLKAGKSIAMHASRLDLTNIQNLSLSTTAAMALSSGDSISQSSKTRDVTSMGKSVESYSGPKNGLPTNGAVREVNINTTPATGFVGGTADSYSLLYGNRNEILFAGNHNTTIAVGNAIYSVGVGTWTASSGANTLVANPGGIAVFAAVGAATFTAAAGATSISGSTGVAVTSAGPVLVRGTFVTLSAPGIKVGGIVSGSDLDPISGLPLVLLGMGSPTHLLAVG